MDTQFTPDLAYAYHAALIQARVWLEHFKADIDGGVRPYPESIDTAIAGINEALQPEPQCSTADYGRQAAE